LGAGWSALGMVARPNRSRPRVWTGVCSIHWRWWIFCGLRRRRSCGMVPLRAGRALLSVVSPQRWLSAASKHHQRPERHQHHEYYQRYQCQQYPLPVPDSGSHGRSRKCVSQLAAGRTQHREGQSAAVSASAGRSSPGSHARTARHHRRSGGCPSASSCAASCDRSARARHASWPARNQCEKCAAARNAKRARSAEPQVTATTKQDNSGDSSRKHATSS